ncbi:MAG: O-antigen ligase family protein, partial [Bacteroidota bacterium]
FTSQSYLLFFLTYFLLRHILARGQSYWDISSKVLLAIGIFSMVLIAYQLTQTYLNEGLGGKAIYKVIGHSGHKNLAASYLFLLFGFAVYFALAGKKQSWYYWLIGVKLILMLLLRSRAVYVAVAAFTATSFLFYAFSQVQLKQLVFRRVLPFALVVGLFGALFVGNTGAGKDYVKYLDPTTYLRSVSGGERLFVWYKTMNLVQEKPILGYGTGNWKLQFPSKNIEGGFRLMEKDLVFTRVHNDFLEVLAETGILGLLFYLSIFVLAIVGLFKSMWQEGKTLNRANVILLATVVGYMLIAFFDFPKERPEHQVLLALLIAASATKGAAFFQSQKLYFQPSKARLKLIIAAFTCFWLLNLPICYYRSVADLSSEKIMVGMVIKDAQLMRDNAQKAHSDWSNLNVMVIPYKWYEGLSYYFEEKYQQAVRPFEEAFRLNPYNFNVLNNYASTLVQLKRYPEAIPLYLGAIEINPKFEEGMFNLAFSYYQLKQYQEALRWVNKVQVNLEKKAIFLKQIQAAM